MNRALETTLRRLEMEYGEGTVMRLGDLPPVSQDALPTGWPALDQALGIGGLPRGRVVEIFGLDGSGKTSLALAIARQAENALYIDADHGLTPEQMRGLYMGRVETLEQALSMVETAAQGFDVVVIDTLAALPTGEDLHCPLGMPPKYPLARKLSTALPRLIGTLARYGCTLVVVSQMREKPGVFYGNPLYSTGGKALKYYAAARIEMRVAGKEEVQARVVKNKCAPPHKEARRIISA